MAGDTISSRKGMPTAASFADDGELIDAEPAATTLSGQVDAQKSRISELSPERIRLLAVALLARVILVAVLRSDVVGRATKQHLLLRLRKSMA